MGNASYFPINGATGNMGLNLILANLGITVYNRYDNVIQAIPPCAYLCVEKPLAL